MSYTITVRSGDDGPTVTATGDVPPGQYEISGHEDSENLTLRVARRGQDGRYVAEATHTHRKG